MEGRLATAGLHCRYKTDEYLSYHRVTAQVFFGLIFAFFYDRFCKG